jgi:hypothetical protein
MRGENPGVEPSTQGADALLRLEAEKQTIYSIMYIQCGYMSMESDRNRTYVGAEPLLQLARLASLATGVGWERHTGLLDLARRFPVPANLLVAHPLGAVS